MISQLNNDQWSSLFWFVCGVITCIGSIQYKMGEISNPAAGFLPFLAGLALSIFSTIGFVESTLRQKKGIRWKSLWKGEKWGRALLTGGALFVFAFLLTPLGFTLCAAIFVCFLLLLGKFCRWPVAIAVAIITALASYGIFAALLRVQFPRGPLGF